MTQPRFSLAALRAYVRIIETGSVTRAAQSLNISQSAVSHHLKTIEASARLPLFARSGHKLTATEEGELLYIDVRDALDILINAERRLAPTPDRRVVIGAQYSFAFHCLAPVYDALQASFPELTLEIHLLADAPGQNGRHLDLCLSSWSLDDDYQTVSNFATAWRPYARAGLVEPGDEALNSAPRISFEGGSDWRAWSSAPIERPLPMRHCDSAGFALELAKQGGGIALCADVMASIAVGTGLLEALSIRSILLEWGQLRFSVNSRSPHTAAAVRIIAWLDARFQADIATLDRHEFR